MGVVVVSCLDSRGATLRYNSKGKVMDIISANQSLIAMITSADATQRYVCSGAPEQSQAADAEAFCRRGELSYYSQLTALCKAIGATLEPALLADVFGKLPAGESYDRIMRELGSDAFYDGPYRYEHAITERDTSKVSLLYFLIHTMAVKHPHDMILFELFESNEQVLAELRGFFIANPEFIPSHVTLRLYHYTGVIKPGEAIVIKGQGLIDADYKQTVLDMFALVKQDRCYLLDAVHPIEELSSDALLALFPVLGFGDGFIRNGDNFFYCDVRAIPPVVLIPTEEGDSLFWEEKEDEEKKMTPPECFVDTLRLLFQSLNKDKRLAVITAPTMLELLDMELFRTCDMNRTRWSLGFLEKGLPMALLLAIDELKKRLKTRPVITPKPTRALPWSPSSSFSSASLTSSDLLREDGFFSVKSSSPLALAEEPQRAFMRK